MKRYIAAVLGPCLLLQFTGCYAFRDLSYSFRPLEKEEDLNSHQKKDEEIKFVLTNGEEITALKKECIYLTKREFILIGKGTLLDKKTKETRTFEGEIVQSDIDSVKSISLDSEEFIICWLKDSTRISFEKENIVYDPNLNSNTSYWLIKQSGFQKTQSLLLIDVNDLKSIEVEELNLAAAIPLGLIGIAALVAFIALLANLPRSHA